MDKKNAIHIHGGILLTHKRDEILSFAILIVQEVIILFEINQTQTDKYCMILFMCGVKQNGWSHINEKYNSISESGEGSRNTGLQNG